LGIPLDSKITNIEDVPYTISFVMRKRMQIDNLNELSKDKRPTDEMIFEGSSEALDKWLDKVLSGKEPYRESVLNISTEDIE
jgi:hypothetical protein